MGRGGGRARSAGAAIREVAAADSYLQSSTERAGRGKPGSTGHLLLDGWSVQDRAWLGFVDAVVNALLDSLTIAHVALWL